MCFLHVDSDLTRAHPIANPSHQQIWRPPVLNEATDLMLRTTRTYFLFPCDFCLGIWVRAPVIAQLLHGYCMGGEPHEQGKCLELQVDNDIHPKIYELIWFTGVHEVARGVCGVVGRNGRGNIYNYNYITMHILKYMDTYYLQGATGPRGCKRRVRRGWVKREGERLQLQLQLHNNIYILKYMDSYCLQGGHRAPRLQEACAALGEMRGT